MYYLANKHKCLNMKTCCLNLSSLKHKQIPCTMIFKVYLKFPLKSSNTWHFMKYKQVKKHGSLCTCSAKVLSIPFNQIHLVMKGTISQMDRKIFDKIWKYIILLPNIILQCTSRLNLMTTSLSLKNDSDNPSQIKSLPQNWKYVSLF